MNKGTCSLLAAGLTTLVLADPPVKYVYNVEGYRPKPRVVIENVCAWPNLTMLPDGTIIATIFNQASHGGA